MKRGLSSCYLTHSTSCLLLTEAHNSVQMIPQFSINCQLEDEEHVSGSLKHVQKLDDVLMTRDSPEDVDLPHGLFPDVESVTVNQILRDVDDFDGD